MIIYINLKLNFRIRENLRAYFTPVGNDTRDETLKFTYVPLCNSSKNNSPPLVHIHFSFPKYILNVFHIYVLC